MIRAFLPLLLSLQAYGQTTEVLTASNLCFDALTPQEFVSTRTGTVIAVRLEYVSGPGFSCPGKTTGIWGCGGLYTGIRGASNVQTLLPQAGTAGYNGPLDSEGLYTLDGFDENSQSLTFNGPAGRTTKDTPYNLYFTQSFTGTGRTCANVYVTYLDEPSFTPSPMTPSPLQPGEVLVGENLCFDAISSATFNIQQTGTVTGVRLVYTGGPGFSCPGQTTGIWGCGGLYVGIRGASNMVTYWPSGSTAGYNGPLDSEGLYTLEGYYENSEQLVFTSPDIHFNTNAEFNLWFTQSFTGSGSTCANVFFTFAVDSASESPTPIPVSPGLPGEVLVGENLCFDALTPQPFTIPQTGTVTSVRVMYTSGPGFSCPGQTTGFWGCGGLYTGIRGSTLVQTLWPRDGTAGFNGPLNSEGLYTLDGYNENSPQLVFNGPDVHYNVGSVFNLYFTQSFTGTGQTCANVYFTFAAESFSESLSPFEFSDLPSESESMSESASQRPSRSPRASASPSFGLLPTSRRRTPSRSPSGRPSRSPRMSAKRRSPERASPTRYSVKHSQVAKPSPERRPGGGGRDGHGSDDGGHHGGDGKGGRGGKDKGGKRDDPEPKESPEPKKKAAASNRLLIAEASEDVVDNHFGSYLLLSAAIVTIGALVGAVWWRSQAAIVSDPECSV